MPKSDKNPKNKRNNFRGHTYYRKAYKRIFDNPLKSEAQYFKINGFSTNKVLWPILAASNMRSSISSMADLIRETQNGCPSNEAVLRCIRNIPETQIEALCNRLLAEQYRKLPAVVRNEFERSGEIIMDKHKDPYWGDAQKVAVIKGQNQHDSYYHFVYLTLDLISEHYRYTIYVKPIVEGFPLETFVREAVQAVKDIITPKRVLCDGEFSNTAVLKFFEAEGITWVARKSQTKAVKIELHGYYIDPLQFLHPRWHLVEIRGSKDKDLYSIHVTAYEIHGTVKVITKPIWDNLSVEDAIKIYQRRFAIDSGYKEKHAFQAVTSSRSWSVRLFLFLISVLLWNVWRLALAWDFVMGTCLSFTGVPLNLTRKIITHDFGNYLMYKGWKLVV